MKSVLAVSVLAALTLALSACSGAGTGIQKEAKYPTGADRAVTGNNIYDKAPSIFGDGGLSIGGDRKKEEGSSMTVNAFLWRATLDTLSFMPLLNADPWGGVVNYDWYVNPQTPNERFKATVFILDTRLRADALNVSVTKEVKDATGNWVTAPVAAQTETDLENAILTKARQLNLAHAN